MRRTARRFRIAAAAVAALVTATTGLLAWHTWSSAQSDRAFLLQQTERRAGQLAASAAGRVGAIVRSVDFVLLEARSVHGVDRITFDALVDRVRASFPEESGLLLQLSVAAADGELVYSTLGLTRRVNIADRDAFRTHLDGGDRLHVSVPVIGRLSGQDSILFTRPVLRDHRFAGTVAISLSLQQLGTLLGSFDTASDADLALLGHGGAVLALSAGVRRAALLGKRLPGLEGLSAGAAAARSELIAGLFGDGAERIVARHDVAGTDLAVVAALDWKTVLEPQMRQFRRTRNNAAALAAAVVLLGGGVIALLLRMSAQQQAVAASEARFRSLSERLQVGQTTARLIVMDWDIAEDRIEWSDSPEWLRGPLPASGRYPLWKDQVHPEDRERFLAERAESIETLHGQVLEYRIVRTDGEVLWLRSHQKVFAGPDGRAQRMVVALLDITAQKLLEDDLRLSEARLAEAQRLAQIGSWELDIAGNRLVWSHEAYRIFEVDRAGFGASYEAFLDLVHPEDRAAVDRAYSRSLDTREPYRIVHRLRMPDGRIKHVEERCETEFAADGRALRSRGTVQDVTERLLAERALRESQAALAGVIDTAMDAIITIDERQRIRSFNPAAERIFGYRAAEMLARPISDLLPERLRDLHHRHVERFGASGETRRDMGLPGEIVGLRNDGTEIRLEATIARIEAGARLQFSVMLRDVTERRRSEQREREQAARLRRLSHRLREVEERERRAMARELHDRIGQNLSTLNLGLGMLGQQFAAGQVEDAEEQLADMQKTLGEVIGHARDLMSDLRPPALEEYGLLASLQDLAADFGRKTRIAVRVEGSPLAPRPRETIEIAMYRIAQEALNNAAKHAGAAQVRLGLASSDGAIELTIGDDGVGFDASQPGNGVPTWGLATMRERAEEAGIELTIDSAPGRGTRITLRAARPA